MGRQLKRVSLTFDWPLNEVWKGFIDNRKTKLCDKCNGSGYSATGLRLKNLWYGYTSFKPEDRGSTSFVYSNDLIVNDQFIAIYEQKRMANIYNKAWMYHLNQDDVNALVKEGRLMDFTHHFTEAGWVKKDPEYIPTAQEVNQWSIKGFGHDSINQIIVCNAEAKRLGLSVYCRYCDGSGVKLSKRRQKIRAEWKKTEPPAGEGYQLWETVSEGSPISPVFKTPEELAQWLVDNPSSSDKDTTYKQWMNFILGDGWSVSSVFVNGKMLSGVQALDYIS